MGRPLEQHLPVHECADHDPEKLMAAQRAGITKVLIPFDNADDLEDVASEIKDKLKITPVKKVSEVLKLLLG